MSAREYRRRERAPKPLRVPAAGAVVGLLVLVLGLELANATIAGLGLLIGVWGIVSFSFLVMSRRMRRTRALRANGK